MCSIKAAFTALQMLGSVLTNQGKEELASFLIGQALPSTSSNAQWNAIENSFMILSFFTWSRANRPITMKHSQ